jgi:hypothetical protein
MQHLEIVDIGCAITDLLQILNVRSVLEPEDLLLVLPKAADPFIEFA